MLVGGGMEVVSNENADRKSPTLVAFPATQVMGLDNEPPRFFCAAAEKMLRKDPRHAAIYATKLLGKRFGHPEILEAKDFIPYALEEDPERGTYLVRFDKDTLLSPEEIVAMELLHVKRHAEVEHGITITDCVLTVDPYATIHERQALIDAAKLAGLNVLELINAPTAFALSYGVERSFEKPELALILDMGASSYRVTVVDFNFTKQDSKSIGQMTIKSHAWDVSLGGRNFDHCLAVKIAEKINSQGHKIDFNDVHTRTQLLMEASKVKESLSINTLAFLHVDNFLNKFDLHLGISREEFEAACSPLFERLTQPIQQSLAIANVSMAEFDLVEIVGGSTRIPKVQEVLTNFAGKGELHKHIIADEGAAFGSAYFAAMQSSSRRLREYKVRDITPYPITITLGDQHTVLFSNGTRVNARKTFSISTDREFTTEISYDASFPQLRERTSCKQIAKYTISGLPSKENLNFTGLPKATLHWRLLPSGLVELTAEAEVTVISLVEVPPPKPKAAEPVNATETEKKADEENIEKKEEQPEVKPEEPATPQFRESKRIHRQTLQIKREYQCVPDIPEASLTSYKARLAEYERKEKKLADDAEARNALETHIYYMRDFIESHSSTLEIVSTPTEISKIQQSLTDAMLWLDDEGYVAPAAESKKKLTELKDQSAGIELRTREYSVRPYASSALRVVIQQSRELLANLTLKVELSQEDQAAAFEFVDNIEKWLNESEAKQEKLNPTDDPAYTSLDIEDKLTSLEKKLKWVATRPALKPKKPTPPPKEEEQTVNPNTAGSTTPNPQEEPQQQATSQQPEGQQEATKSEL
ncbi:heat-shock protein 70 [Pelomyxa schiedti]|nr:heat-shock protein 70 [Pelomyxa schiedti]